MGVEMGRKSKGTGRRAPRSTPEARPTAKRRQPAKPRASRSARANGQQTGVLDGVTRALGRGWRAVKDGAGALIDELDRSPTDALEMLKAQHTNVEVLFKSLSKTEDPQQRRDLVTELAESLTIHATIEEELFYPAITTTSTDALVKESFEEHAEMKQTLAELVALDASDDEFIPTLKHLEEEVKHHAKEEEERKLFPRVERLLDAEMREAIGQEMLARIVELQQEGDVMAMARNPAEAESQQA